MLPKPDEVSFGEFDGEQVVSPCSRSMATASIRRGPSQPACLHARRPGVVDGFRGALIDIVRQEGLRLRIWLLVGRRRRLRFGDGRSKQPISLWQGSPTSGCFFSRDLLMNRWRGRARVELGSGSPSPNVDTPVAAIVPSSRDAGSASAHGAGWAMPGVGRVRGGASVFRGVGAADIPGRVTVLVVDGLKVQEGALQDLQTWLGVAGVEGDRCFIPIGKCFRTSRSCRTSMSSRTGCRRF